MSNSYKEYASKEYVRETIISDGGVSSWNDLTDKPFYEEGTNITWDGNTEGLESIDAFPDMPGAMVMCKVSDLVLTPEDVIGGKLSVTSLVTGEVTTQEILADHVQDSPEAGAFMISMVTVMVVYDSSKNPNGISAGIWFLKTNMEGAEDNIFVSSLWCGQIETLDEKFIPSTIARTSDLETVENIAKGANQAKSYDNYSAMITDLNDLKNDVYNVGQNIMIVTLEVPDLWVSGIADKSVTYKYVDDATFVTALKNTGSAQVGYYILSMLETQKVDLTNYPTTEEVENLIKNSDAGLTTDEVNALINSAIGDAIGGKY